MSKKNNFQKSLYLLFFLFASMLLHAQNGNNKFSTYAKFISKNLDIVWKKPKGFIDLKTSTPWGPSVNRGPGFLYQSMLQSKNKECLILYPQVSLLADNKTRIDERMPRSQMTGEIKTALGFAQDRSNGPDKTTFDFNKYVKTLIGNDINKQINADTIFIAQIPLSKPYQGKYPYCTGIYICKKKRPPMFFKCFFSEEGKLNESTYLKKILETVKYQNENWKLNESAFSKDNYNYFFKPKSH